MQIRYEILISNTRTARYDRESYLNELSSKKTKEKHVRGGYAANVRHIIIIDHVDRRSIQIPNSCKIQTVFTIREE